MTTRDQINILRQKREERARRTQALLSQFGGQRGAAVAAQLAGTQQEVIQPSTDPQIAPEAAEQFRVQQASQREASTPLGNINVGAQDGAAENRGKPEFGDFKGSGILENIAGAALPALENVQKGIEASVGTLTSTASSLIPGVDLFGIEANLAKEREARGVESRLPDFLQASPLKVLDTLLSGNPVGEIQAQAAAFRVTDMPSFAVDIIPGEGVVLPWGGTLNEVDIGVKGALELIPEIALGVATAGTSTGASIGRKVLSSTANALGKDVLTGGVKLAKVSPKAAKAAAKVTPELVKRSMDAAGSVAKVDYNVIGRRLSEINDPELGKRIRNMSNIRKLPMSAFWGIGSPMKVADLSRGAVKGVYTYVMGIDQVDKLVNADMALFADKIGYVAQQIQAPVTQPVQAVKDFARRSVDSGRRGLPLVSEAIEKVDGVPFTYTKKGVMNGTSILEIDGKGKSWTEVFENFFAVPGSAAKTSERAKSFYKSADIGTWDASVGRGGAYVGGKDSDLASFIRHYQDTIAGSELRYKEAGGVFKFGKDKEGLERVAPLLDLEESSYIPRDPFTGIELYDEVDELNTATRGGGKAAPGSTPSSLKERSLTNLELQEKIAKGEYTLAGPMETLASHTRSMTTAGFDIQHRNALKASAAKRDSGLFDFGSAKSRVEKTISDIGKGVSKSQTSQQALRKTIAKIEGLGKDSSTGNLRGFPQVAQALRKANDIDDATERLAALEGIKDVFRSDVKNLNGQYFVPRNAKTGGANVVNPRNLNPTDSIPAYTGIFFESKKEAERVVKLHGLHNVGKLEAVSQWSAQAGDIFRVGRTGFDFGFHLIQGIPSLGYAAAMTVSPGWAIKPVNGVGGVRNASLGLKMSKAWGEAAAVSFDAFFHKDRLLKTIMNDVDLATDFSQRGGQLSKDATDIYDALKAESLLSGLDIGKFNAADALEKLTFRFENAFVAPGDYIRLKFYEAMRPSAALKGEEGLNELAAVLNNMTGSLSSSASGIAPTLQRLERGFLFFSPRYTRSSIALLSDVFKGNIQGEAARKSMIGMAGLGMASYITTVNLMQEAGSNQELHLDPSKSSFMTLDIGGEKVGVGGFWTQFTKLSSRLAETAWDEDAREAFLGDDTIRTNPLIRWVRSRSAPSAGVGWDYAAGEDFLGRQIESPLDWTKHVFTQVTPIWAEAALLSSPYKTGAPGIAGELLGARVRPASASERRSDLRDALAQNLYDKDWVDLNGLQRDKIGENGLANGVAAADVTALAELDELVHSQRAETGKEVDLNIEKYHSKVKDIEAQWMENVSAGIDHLDSGAIDIGQFKKVYLDSSGGVRRQQLSELNDKDGDFAIAIEHFEVTSEKFGEDNPEDVAYNEYITSIIATDAFDTPQGHDYRAQDEAVDLFKKKWGDEVYAYVYGRFGEGRGMPEIVTEIYAGQRKFEYYYRGVEEETLKSMPMSDSVAESYARWLKSTANEAKELEATEPGLKSFLRKIGDVRLQLRKRDQLLDAWLFRIGKTDTFAHRDNKLSPDGVDDAREFWRNPMPFPLEVWGIQSGVAV